MVGRKPARNPKPPAWQRTIGSLPGEAGNVRYTRGNEATPKPAYRPISLPPKVYQKLLKQIAEAQKKRKKKGK